jgi:hypothetical protein
MPLPLVRVDCLDRVEDAGVGRRAAVALSGPATIYLAGAVVVAVTLMAHGKETETNVVEVVDGPAAHATEIVNSRYDGSPFSRSLVAGDRIVAIDERATPDRDAIRRMLTWVEVVVPRARLDLRERPFSYIRSMRWGPWSRRAADVLGAFALLFLIPWPGLDGGEFFVIAYRVARAKPPPSWFEALFRSPWWGAAMGVVVLLITVRVWEYIENVLGWHLGLFNEGEGSSCSPLVRHEQDSFSRLAAALLGLERGAPIAERPGGTHHGTELTRADSSS